MFLSVIKSFVKKIIEWKKNSIICQIFSLLSDRRKALISVENKFHGLKKRKNNELNGLNSFLLKAR